jgi:hypothetical protein
VDFFLTHPEEAVSYSYESSVPMGGGYVLSILRVG